MSTPTSPPANFGCQTLDDRMAVEGTTKLVAGRVDQIVGSGLAPSQVVFKIASQLEPDSKVPEVGFAYAGGSDCTRPAATDHLGDTAVAESAVPGWRLVVADIFR